MKDNSTKAKPVADSSEPERSDHGAAPVVLSSARTVQLIMLLVCVLGLGVAVELTHIHYESHTNPQFESICAINEALNCETVARSPWSVVAGLPVSVWGMMAYSLFVILCSFSLVRRVALNGFFIVATSGALAASLALAYISTFIIQSLCLFCTTLYVVNITLFILAIIQLRVAKQTPQAAIVSDLHQVFAAPRFFVPLAFAFILMVSLAYPLIPVYWKSSQFDALPVLDHGKTDDGHYWIGAKNPRLTVLEFSDYECPFCREAHFQTRMMLGRYKDDVRLVHRHMAMDNKCNEYLQAPFHERACEFAYAAECAGEQGKFWQMNDALFGAQETQSALQVDLDEIVDTLKLNRKKFDACLKSPRPVQSVGADIDDGTRRQMPGTPTYFIGAQPYPGGIPERTIRNVLKKRK